jgi:hypothetical protein
MTASSLVAAANGAESASADETLKALFVSSALGWSRLWPLALDPETTRLGLRSGWT